MNIDEWLAHARETLDIAQVGAARSKNLEAEVARSAIKLFSTCNHEQTELLLNLLRPTNDLIGTHRHAIKELLHLFNSLEKSTRRHN